MMKENFIPSVWSHLSWWHFLFQIWTFRKSFHSSPLQITWIPAHVAENTPAELITREIALKFNTTIWDILNNRKADYFAKKAVDRIRKIPKKDIEVIHQQIASWQLFLAKVSAFVADTQTEPVNLHKGEVPTQQPHQEEFPSSAFGKILPHNVHGAHPISVFQDLLPRWEWQPNLVEYTWFSFIWDQNQNKCSCEDFRTRLGHCQFFFQGIAMEMWWSFTNFFSGTCCPS